MCVAACYCWRMIWSAALLLQLLQAPAPQPTFKSGVNFVEVDVVVIDRAGQPVRGLGQGDFEVYEDGKLVRLATFVAVDLPQAPADSTIPPIDRSGTSIATNGQADDGRVILVVLDDYHVRFDAGFAARTKTIARRLVERLGPSDQAAVVATSGRSTMQAEFTGDKARLVDAIDRFFPQSERASTGVAAERSPQGLFGRSGGRSGGFSFIEEIKARAAMDAMSRAARALSEIPHRRKAMLLVSEGLPASVEEIVSNPNASGAWDSLRDFVLTAQRSNIAIYTVDPCGLSLDCSRPAQDNLRSLAENTGGFAVLNTNAPEASVERIVAENGTYYLLGYASAAPPNDGRRHRISVRTRVRDVVVRARDGYVAPRQSQKPTSAPAPLDMLVGAPIQTRGLTMRVAAVPAPLASSPGAAVVVAIEVPAHDAGAAGKIDFSVVAIDSEGTVRTRQRFSGTFEPAVAAPAGWVRLRTHFAVSGGTYQVRIAAVGANGMQGSVFTDVTVPKLDGELAVGGLSLVASASRAVTGAKELPEVLPLTPLAARELPADVTAAHVPVRVGRGAASGTVTFTATLIGPGGRATTLDARTAPASEYAAGPGQIYRIEIPPGLDSGDHRLAVDVVARRTRVSREMVFRVPAGRRP